VATAEELLGQWLKTGQELLAAQEGSAKEAALEQRIAELEERFKDKPKNERLEALGDLSDDEYELIRAHREGATAPDPKPEPEAELEPEAEADPPKAKTRPGRKSGQAYTWTVDDDGKVQRLDIPHVYSGPDEDAEVPLPEEQAA
jgi:hypothetical protein